jgi:ketosteroid isomerase-like protein
MSEENVEIGLAAVDAWNRGDREAWLALWDEEAEFYPLRAQLEGESYSGHEGLERFLVEMTEEWEEVRFEIEETRDA